MSGGASPGNNDAYIGGYSAGGATLDGGGTVANVFAGTHSGVTLEYLTIQNFNPVSNTQWTVNHDSGPSWTMDYDTVQDNYPGAGMGVGTNGVAEYDCLTHNGEYGIQAYTVTGANSLTGGPSNVTIEHDEISYNDQCNLEGIPLGSSPGDFPITPPSNCTSGPNKFANPTSITGCGCSGGAHFWESNESNFSYNYDHDNYSVGSWWDTNNNDMTVTHNYYANNYGQAVTIEISYNPLIEDNNFLDNAQGLGACGGTCGWGGNLVGAIYLSESGCDANVPAPGIGSPSTCNLEYNNFSNNWDGVSMWENADRFCSSWSNTSHVCVLDNPSTYTLSAATATGGYSSDGVTNGTTTVTSASGFKNQNGTPTTPTNGWTVYGPHIPSGDTIASCASANSCTLTVAATGSGTALQIWAMPSAGCSSASLAGTSSGNAYFNNCRWHTQNLGHREQHLRIHRRFDPRL